MEELTEWERIKAIQPSKGVMVHVSKTFRKLDTVPVTYAPNRGVTLDIGRNKAKRIARAKGHRHIGKAPRNLP